MDWNDTPKAPDQISTTQLPIQSNFTGLPVAFEINHYGINDALKGLHKKMTLLRQADAPADATVSSNKIALYDLLSNSKDELFVKTYTGQRDFTALPNILSRGLASGVVIKIGSSTFSSVPASGISQPITFNEEFAATPHAILLSVVMTSGFRNTAPQYIKVAYSAADEKGFQLNAATNTGTQTGITIQYMALGV